MSHDIVLNTLRKMKRATVKEIAKETNLSTQSVSAKLNRLDKYNLAIKKNIAQKNRNGRYVYIAK